MKTLMERLYDNLSEAKAFELNFTNFVHIYDDMAILDFLDAPCPICGKAKQSKDYLAPKSNCKKPYGILSNCEFGVDPGLRDELIAHFDITEKDFRPIRNKRGEIVYYQVTPAHTMLPVHKENRWLEYRPCPQCGSVRYSAHDYENENGEFYNYISQEALDQMHDLNVTYERFDCHNPRYIISRRVYDFLIEKYPRSQYFPLFVKQDT